MITQRTRGLQNAIFVSQATLVALTLWVSILIAFKYFAAASPLHMDRYPVYGALLVLGLLFELITREAHGLESQVIPKTILDHHAASLRQTLFAVGTLLLYLAAAKDAFISRWVLAIDVPLLYTVLLLSNRLLPTFLARKLFSGSRAERALLIGGRTEVMRLKSWLRGKEVFGFRAVGVVSAVEEANLLGLPWLGRPTNLQSILEEQRITQVILLELPDSAEDHERLVEMVESHGARLLILSNLEDKLRHRVIHFKDGGLDFIVARTEPLEDPLNRALKRMLDLAVAAPIVIFVIPPVGIAVWLLQRWQSPGPLFYWQVRAGIQNRQFCIVKFRTMHADNPEESRQASPNDERIYPAGRWLRRLSLDEIPQFWNVLTGEMSVCGPRPHLIAHNADFAQKMRRYHLRTFVKPGITGLAQIRGFRGEIRSVTDIEQRLESDIAYFERWRLSLDVAIIFRTVVQILLFAGDGLLRTGRRSKPSRPASAPEESELESAVEPLRGIYIADAVRREFRQILGIRFFTGDVEEAVAFGMRGGLVVAPSAPVLLGLEEDVVHRAAIRGSALAITDSGLMVLLWKLLTGENATRVSGLKYLKVLLEQPQLREPGAVLWVMPSGAAIARNLAWLKGQGFEVSEEDCYLAPQYSRGADGRITDPALIEIARNRRPAHVIMAVGGGVQEKLGAELLKNLNYRPSVHCTGAAIGFLSGEQVRIPMWADRFCLGWFFRCLDEPLKFVPRYWESRKLVSLMLHYHGRLPGITASVASDVSTRSANSGSVTVGA